MNIIEEFNTQNKQSRLSIVLGLSSLDDIGDLTLKFLIFQNPAFFVLMMLRTGFLAIHGLLSLCVSADGKHRGYKQMCRSLCA